MSQCYCQYWFLILTNLQCIWAAARGRCNGEMIGFESNNKVIPVPKCVVFTCFSIEHRVQCAPYVTYNSQAYWDVADLDHFLSNICLWILAQKCKFHYSCVMKGDNLGIKLINIGLIILYVLCFIPQQEPYQSLKRLVWPVRSTWANQTVLRCSATMTFFTIF